MLKITRQIRYCPLILIAWDKQPKRKSLTIEKNNLRQLRLKKKKRRRRRKRKHCKFIVYILSFIQDGGGSWFFRPRSGGGLANFTPIAGMGHLISEPKFKIPTPAPLPLLISDKSLINSTYWAAHTCIGNVREYPPPPPPGFHYLFWNRLSSPPVPRV